MNSLSPRSFHLEHSATSFRPEHYSLYFLHLFQILFPFRRKTYLDSQPFHRIWWGRRCVGWVGSFHWSFVLRCCCRIVRECIWIDFCLANPDCHPTALGLNSYNSPTDYASKINTFINFVKDYNILSYSKSSSTNAFHIS